MKLQLNGIETNNRIDDCNLPSACLYVCLCVCCGACIWTLLMATNKLLFITWALQWAMSMLEYALFCWLIGWARVCMCVCACSLLLLMHALYYALNTIPFYACTELHSQLNIVHFECIVCAIIEQQQINHFVLYFMRLTPIKNWAVLVFFFVSLSQFGCVTS